MIKFVVPTPVGFRVQTTESYWSLLLMKHPEIAGRESDVQETLLRPDLVCRSRHDGRVHFFIGGMEGTISAWWPNGWTRKDSS